jgi:hypothetical protein
MRSNSVLPPKDGEVLMAQIWLTYEELARFTDRTPIAARETVIEWGWVRRRSRDGVTRVMLPHEIAALYMRRCVLDADDTEIEQQNPLMIAIGDRGGFESRQTL